MLNINTIISNMNDKFNLKQAANESEAVLMAHAAFQEKNTSPNELISNLCHCCFRFKFCSSEINSPCVPGSTRSRLWHAIFFTCYIAIPRCHGSKARKNGLCFHCQCITAIHFISILVKAQTIQSHAIPYQRRTQRA